MQKPEDHKIDELKEELYSRGYEPRPMSPRGQFDAPVSPVDTQWKHQEASAAIVQPSAQPDRSRSFLKKITIGAGIFFIISAIAAAFIFFFGWNIISTNKVDIAFYGPVSIGANENLNFDIAVENKNNADLLDPVLYIDFPEGTKEAGDVSSDLLHAKETLDPIAPGQAGRVTVGAVLFGQEHEVKEIKVKLEYRIRGSDTAVFSKEKIYDVTISSTPVSFSVISTRELVSGEEATFSVDIASNSSAPLRNLIVKGDYPFGFRLTSTDPAPTIAPNIWSIPSLNPGEKKTITVKGIIEGEEGDERTLRFTTGIQHATNQKEIATKFLAAQSSVLLRKPPIAVSMNIAGSSGSDIVANAGAKLGGTITIMNNLPVQLVDVKIDASFGGPAFDPGSPESQIGFYRSVDKTIVWDQSVVPRLARLNPGETVTVDFSFSSLSSALASSRNGTMNIAASATGQQLTEDGSEEVVVSQSRTVKLQSVMALTSRLVYSVGPFKNTGPIPPKAENKTTYTVAWTLSNSANPISGAEVKAVLPQYVSWKNVISPANENISFDPVTREVSWNVGDMDPWASRQGIFQVELLPSTNQIDTVPVIVGSIHVRGLDTFTNRDISSDVSDLTASLSTDPKYGDKDGVVR